MTIEERTTIGETVGILRALGGSYAFKSLSKEVKLILIEQADILNNLVREDLDRQNPKAKFIREY